MLLSIAGAIAGYHLVKSRSGKKPAKGMKFVGIVGGWYAGNLAESIMVKTYKSTYGDPFAKDQTGLEAKPTTNFNLSGW